MNEIMSKSLKPIPAEIQAKIEKAGIAVGDWVIDDRGEFSKILRLGPGHGKYQDSDKIYVEYVDEDDIGKENGYVHKCTIEKFWHYRHLRVDGTPDEWRKIAFSSLASLDEFEVDDTQSDSTALVPSGGMNRLLQAKKEVEEKRNKLEIIERIVEMRKSEMNSMIHSMNKIIHKMTRIVAVFELYLGVEEEVVQIVQGTPDSGPIHIRQLVLYMDEEVGDPTDGGIDFRKVDDFDDWIVDDRNFEKVIPESKGLVAIRPSRQERRYSDDPMVNAFLNAKNSQCYILIRNGDNLYRIWVDMSIGEVFFPTRERMAKILADLDEHEWDREKAENTFINFSRNAFLIQGLIDRTEIFYPLPAQPDVRNQDDPNVIYIYDAELTLPNGRLPYWDWHKQLNNKIERGTRVHVAPIDWYKHGTRSRFLRYYNEYQEPSPPHPGLYNIDRIIPPDDPDSNKRVKHGERLVILYNPGGMVYGDWYHDWHERKNRVSFCLKRNDPFVFNYDLLDLDDVEFYINSRVERQRYLDMMPTLYGIKKHRLQEIENEKGFVKLMAQKEGVAEETVWEAVEWWKRKVIMKRPLDNDDKKAWRMIRSRIKGEK